MDKELKKLVAAFGRYLIAIAGEAEPEPEPKEKPEEEVKQLRKYTEKTAVCVKCGVTFTCLSRNAKLCPDCKNAIKKENLIKFREAMAAKNRAPVRRTDDVDMVYGNSVEL